MANHKSAIKRHRQSLVRKDRNRVRRAEVRTAIKKAVAAATAGQGDEAKKLAVSAESLMAKAAKKGLYHRANLKRKVSRLHTMVAKSAKK